MPDNNQVIQEWSESAPFWEKHRKIIVAMFAPVTQALVQEAGITAGCAVLDVATGPGEPALSIAEVTGPSGKVVGTDAVPEMIAAARREGERRGLPQVSFEVAPDDRLPFPAETFDAVVSRFGVMFFASPVGFVREALRVLKPGGKLAFAVWHFAERNPFFQVVSQVVARYVESPAADADAPDAFRFATPGKLQSVLVEAGAMAVSERLLRFSIEVPISAEEFWTLRSEMSDKLRAKLARLSQLQVAKLRGEVIEAADAYVSGHGLKFPAEVVIVSGRKASA